MISSKMWLDSDLSNQPPNTNRECYNINNFIKLGSITQELGTKIISTYNKQPIYILPINNNDIVLFNLDNTIGIIHNEVYTQKYTSSILGFTTNTIISCDFYINNKGERIIIFVYNLGNKQINIDTGIVEDLLNVSVEPTVESTILNYGNLQVGGYKLFFRYVNIDKSTTNFYKNYTPIVITDYKESGVLTNKSIHLSISNINTAYKYIEVGYVQVKDNIQTAYIVKRFDTKPTITYTITENETKEPIDLDELINDKIIYKNISNIKIAKDYVYGYGIKFNKELDDIQSITNNLSVKWYSELKTPTRTTSFKSFAHGEVYALYIRYKFKWGYSRWYTLIGRQSVGSERDSVLLNLKTYLKYQIEDTCSTIGTHLSGNKGNFSFWENEEEDYPVDGGYPVSKVRHFKFPSVNWMRNNLYDNTSYGVDTFDSLGIFIDNINLSLIKDNNDIAAYGYELGFAKRSPSNSLVVGQSIQIFNDQYTGGGDELKYTTGQKFNNGGNFRTSYGGSNTNYKQLNNFKTFPLELLVNQNDINIDAFREELKLTTNVSNIDSNSSNNPLHDTYSYSNLFSGFNLPATGSISDSLATNYKNNVIKSRIILNNTIKDDVNNLYSETHYSIVTDSYLDSLTDGTSAILAGKKVINTPFVNGNEKTKLVTLLKHNKNCYSDFQNQNIVGLDKVGSVFLGDVYLNITDVVLSGTYIGAYREPLQTSSADDKQGIFEGNMCIKSFIAESLYNFSGIKDTLIQHYTRTSLTPLYYIILKRDTDPNLFNVSINKDYTIFNDLTYSKVVKDEDTNDSDYYIVRSGNIQNNQSYHSREFSIDDIFLVPKNKGKVINLEEGQDFIYVHTETTLFRTVGANKAAVDNTDNLLYVKVGDIFQTPLIEVQHSELGLMGVQHKHSCRLTEYGYCFIDKDKYKVFLIGDKGIKVLSSDGLINTFKTLLKNSYSISPFIGESIFIEFDDFTERLFVVIGNTCLIYSFINQGWLCYTTYIPDFLFTTRTNFYSLKNNRIYKHNDDRRVNYIYGEQIDSIANVVLPTIEEGQNLHLINGVKFNNSVFDALRFRNSYQDSGEVELIEISNEENIENINGNVRKFQGEFLYYNIRDYCTFVGLIDNNVSIDVFMKGTEPKEFSNISIL